VPIAFLHCGDPANAGRNPLPGLKLAVFPVRFFLKGAAKKEAAGGWTTFALAGGLLGPLVLNDARFPGKQAMSGGLAPLTQPDFNSGGASPAPWAIIFPPRRTKKSSLSKTTFGQDGPRVFRLSVVSFSKHGGASSQAGKKNRKNAYIFLNCNSSI